MNIKEVMSYLIQNLPKHTDLFTEKLNLVYTAKIENARTVRVDCTLPHGIIVNQKIYCIKVRVANLIEEAYRDNGFLVIKTAEEHDYTNSKNPVSVEIEYNGTIKQLEIINVPDRFTLEFAFPSDTSESDIVGGVVWEEREYGGNGVVAVTVVSSDKKSFLYEINENDPDLPILGTNAKIEQIVLGVRVAGCPDPTRAMQIFTETFAARKTWAFVMMPDEQVSKDPYSMTEAQASFTNLDSNRQRIMTNIDVLVIFPTTELGAIEEISLSCGEVRNSIIKSLAGLEAEGEGVSNTYKTVYVGSNMYVYNTATYVRSYSFQSVFDIDYENTARNTDTRSVALRESFLQLPIGDINVKFAEPEEEEEVDDWILSGGVWADDGIWVDDAIWEE